MKVTINETQFANMLNGLKDFCATEGDERPALESIYMMVSGATISAYATDGYYAAKMIFDCDNEDWDVSSDSSFCIKPFAFKPSKKCTTCYYLRRRQGCYRGDNNKFR